MPKKKLPMRKWTDAGLMIAGMKIFMRDVVMGKRVTAPLGAYPLEDIYGEIKRRKLDKKLDEYIAYICGERFRKPKLT